MDARVDLRVIAAVSVPSRPRIQSIFPDCEVRFVDTAAELACALQRERCDLLLVGAHFEQSTALAVLERLLPEERRCPAIFVRGRPSPAFGESTVHAMRMAAHAVGCVAFVDLLDYPDTDAGNAAVRGLLERALGR